LEVESLPLFSTHFQDILFIPQVFYSALFFVLLKQVLELLDTVFMILRHKSRQISFLHVYHHSSMLILSDLARRYYPWPAIGVFLGLNSFVHVLLYLYYGLTALDPLNPPTWKKQMTQVTVVCFVFLFCYKSP
jgi:elongation of very long chain fatty acids protein 4